MTEMGHQQRPAGNLMETGMRKFNGETIIENEAAYEKGKQARIRFNRQISNRKRWIEESGQEIVDRCLDFLHASGQFAPSEIVDKNGFSTWIAHPICKASFGEFYTKMRKSLEEWNRLTPAQEKTVLNMIVRAEERIAARAAAKEAKAASAKHIGVVGERRQFDLTIKFTTDYETDFGVTFVHVMEDADGNVVVYKGSKSLGNKDDAISIKATVKEHGERDGIAQTIISRPKD